MPRGHRILLDPSKPNDALLVRAKITSYRGLVGGTDMAERMREQTVPPNHPFIPRWAKRLGIAEHQFKDAFTSGPEMNQSQADRLAERYKIGAGTKTPDAPKTVRRRRARQRANVNPPTLLRTPRVETKQDGTAALARTLNLAIMDRLPTVVVDVADLAHLLSHVVRRGTLLDPIAYAQLGRS